MAEARVIQVIKTDDLRGSGVENDPYRRIDQYFTLEGELLWERDTWQEQKQADEQRCSQGQITSP